MMYTVFDSNSGDELGTIHVRCDDEEEILGALHVQGYLEGLPDSYEVNRSEHLSDDAFVVYDTYAHAPFLALERAPKEN